MGALLSSAPSSTTPDELGEQMHWGTTQGGAESSAKSSVRSVEKLPMLSRALHFGGGDSCGAGGGYDHGSNHSHDFDDGQSEVSSDHPTRIADGGPQPCGPQPFEAVKVRLAEIRKTIAGIAAEAAQFTSDGLAAQFTSDGLAAMRQTSEVHGVDGEADEADEADDEVNPCASPPPTTTSPALSSILRRNSRGAACDGSTAESDGGGAEREAIGTYPIPTTPQDQLLSAPVASANPFPPEPGPLFPVHAAPEPQKQLDVPTPTSPQSAAPAEDEVAAAERYAKLFLGGLHHATAGGARGVGVEVWIKETLARNEAHLVDSEPEMPSTSQMEAEQFRRNDALTLLLDKIATTVEKIDELQLVWERAH
jgi:hypothetical protein